MDWGEASNAFFEGFKNGQGIAREFRQQRWDEEDRSRKMKREDEESGDRATARERDTTRFGWEGEEQKGKAWERQYKQDTAPTVAQAQEATGLEIEGKRTSVAKSKTDAAKAEKELAGYDEEHGLDLQAKRTNIAADQESIAGARQRRRLIDEDADVERSNRAMRSYLQDPASEWLNDPDMRANAVMLRDTLKQIGKKGQRLSPDVVPELYRFASTLFRPELSAVNPAGGETQIVGAHFTPDSKHLVLEVAYKGKNGEDYRGVLSQSDQALLDGEGDDETDRAYKIPVKEIVHRFDGAAALAAGSEKFLRLLPEAREGVDIRETLIERLGPQLGTSGLLAGGRGRSRTAQQGKPVRIADEDGYTYNLWVMPGEKPDITNKRQLVSKFRTKAAPDDAGLGVFEMSTAPPHGDEAGVEHMELDDNQAADLYIQAKRAAAQQAKPGTPEYQQLLYQMMSENGITRDQFVRITGAR